MQYIRRRLDVLSPIDPFPDVKAYADATAVVVTIYGERGVTQVLVVQ